MALKHYVLGLFFVQKQIFRCENHRLQSFGGMNTAEQLLIGTYIKNIGESLMLQCLMVFFVLFYYGKFFFVSELVFSHFFQLLDSFIIHQGVSYLNVYFLGIISENRESREKSCKTSYNITTEGRRQHELD